MSDDSMPACGGVNCGCLSVAQMNDFMRWAREDGKRQANFALGLPEFFNVDRDILEATHD